MFTYREKQLKAIHACKVAIGVRKRKAIICVAPTGFGKSGVGAGIASGAVAKGKQVLFLVDRKKLATQMRKKLRDFGIESGIIMAGHASALVYPVQVASVRTLINRMKNLAFVPDVIVADECHRSNGATFKAIFAKYPDAIVLGLTATPVRTSGDGLGVGHGGIFEEIIPTSSIAELIADGTLCRYKYFLPELVDSSDIAVRGGEHVQQEIDKAIDAKPGIVGDFVSYWLVHARGRPTMVFASSLKEAARLCAAATTAGIRATTIDASSSEMQGEEALDGLTTGTLDMAILVGCWVEGVDIPPVSCIVLMCITASITKFLQMIGRGFRPSPETGKEFLMIVDHMGNAGRMVDGEFIPKHGMPDWEHDWQLEGKKVGKKISPDHPQPLTQCTECSRTFKPAPVCPECGHPVPIRERKPHEQIAGKIVEISAEQSRQDAEQERLEVLRRAQEVGMADSYEKLLAIALERGYKPSWAGVRWKIKKQQMVAAEAKRAAKLAAKLAATGAVA